jgi:hypothetical protein
MGPKPAPVLWETGAVKSKYYYKDHQVMNPI